MQEILCSLLRFADKFSPPKKVYAHCDIPCGVYETDSMEHAVETIEKLTKKLLDTGAMGNDMQINDRNTFIRSIDVREKYAQTCKQEILVLWTDYFKAEHLQKWPNLHELVWKATKQCSTVKRTISMEEVQKLRSMVEEIAKVFAESKAEHRH